MRYAGCAKKVTPFWYLSFLPLLDALFAIFVYLHIIFVKCLISESSVVSIQNDGLTSRMVHHSTLRKNTINYLKRENVLFIEPRVWPPDSPDLNLVDYAVWGALRQQV